MKVFYGAAIQGNKSRAERAEVHRFLLEAIKGQGFEVVAEHTSSKSLEDATKILEKRIGPIPKEGIERRVYIRNKIIEFIEGEISAAIFEVSVPSLGTGVEIAHAYLRPRMGLEEIPVLALYEKNYWPNKLSTMIRGIDREKVPQFTLREYSSLEEAKKIVGEFLEKIRK